MTAKHAYRTVWSRMLIPIVTLVIGLAVGLVIAHYAIPVHDIHVVTHYVNHSVYVHIPKVIMVKPLHIMHVWHLRHVAHLHHLHILHIAHLAHIRNE